jgi:hypothetical protein
MLSDEREEAILPGTIDRIREQGRHQGMIQGIGIVAAFIARDHGHPGMAKEALELAGVTPQDLKKAKVDDYDLKPLLKLWDK